MAAVSLDYKRSNHIDIKHKFLQPSYMHKSHHFILFLLNNKTISMQVFTTYCQFPSSYTSEPTRKLASSVPASIKLHKRLQSFISTVRNTQINNILTYNVNLNISQYYSKQCKNRLVLINSDFPSKAQRTRNCPRQF